MPERLTANKNNGKTASTIPCIVCNNFEQMIKVRDAIKAAIADGALSGTIVTQIPPNLFGPWMEIQRQLTLVNVLISIVHH